MCLERNKRMQPTSCGLWRELTKTALQVKNGKKNKLTKMACKTLKTDCWCCIVVECLLLGMIPSD